MKKYWILLTVVLSSLSVSAQVTGEVNVLDRDVFYFHYTPPNVITDDFEYQRFSEKLNLPPVKLGRFSLFNTFGLDVHRFKYKDDSLGENTSDLQTFYNLNYSVLASYQIADEWSFNLLAAPFVASNLVEPISRNDWHFNGNVTVERTFHLRNGGYLQAAFGAGYLTLNGTTRLVPLAHLKARWNEKWSLVIGLPNTYLKWDLHPKHSLKALVDLNDITANLSKPIAIGNSSKA
ncbi:MAG: hypothetical protein AAGJ18_15510, partial [Bacteroidota bacterium]